MLIEGFEYRVVQFLGSQLGVDVVHFDLIDNAGAELVVVVHRSAFHSQVVELVHTEKQLSVGVLVVESVRTEEFPDSTVNLRVS